MGSVTWDSVTRDSVTRDSLTRYPVIVSIFVIKNLPVEPVIRVTRIRIGIIAAEVVASPRVLKIEKQ